MRFVLIALGLLFVMVIAGCEETVPACDMSHECRMEWQTGCSGDKMHFYCGTDDYECVVHCKTVCINDGYAGYGGECSYSAEDQRDLCWCTD